MKEKLVLKKKHSFICEKKHYFICTALNEICYMYYLNCPVNYMHIAISYNQTMNFLFQNYDRFVQYLTKKKWMIIGGIFFSVEWFADNQKLFTASLQEFLSASDIFSYCVKRRKYWLFIMTMTEKFKINLL